MSSAPPLALVGADPLVEGRLRAVRFARDLIGLSANPADPVSRARYLEVIAPGETPARAEEMALMSGCGLVARAVLRAAGVRHPRLERPYVTTKAFEDIETIAHEAGGLLAGAAALEGGDLVIVAEPAHVFTVIEVTDYAYDDALDVVSVDGGVPDDHGHQGIVRRTRALRGGYDVLHGGPTRRVLWRIDLGAVLRRFGSIATAEGP